MTFDLRKGQTIDQRALLRDLTDLQYKRGDTGFVRGTFRVRGDTVELFPAHYEDAAWRITLFGNTIESISEFDPLTGKKSSDLLFIRVFANSHYVTPRATLTGAIKLIRAELECPPAGAERRRPLPRSAAARAAHAVRPRDDGSHRLVRRHRELFALLLRPQSRRAATDSVRIPPRQCPGLRRRKPRHHRPARRHVSRRPSAQGDPRRIRLPPALGHGQPPAPLRGVERHAPADRLCLAPPPARGRWSRPAASSPSRSSAPPASPTRRSRSAPPKPRSTTSSTRSARSPRPATARSSPCSPRRWRKTSPNTCTSRASASATCTPTSTPSSASRSSATSASAPSTSSSASTCCAKASTSPNARWSPSSTPTRKASSAPKPA